MKRCSECDFIYEDDQNLCDMDGRELICDPTLQSFPVNAAITSQTRPAKLRGRRLTLAVAIAVLVGTFLSVGFSGLTREDEPQTTKAPAANVIRVPKSVPEQIPAAPSISPTPAPSRSPEKTKARPATGSPLAASASRYRSTSPERETVRSRQSKANHKKDSGIGEFFKKTGRILKRPFKF